MKNQKLTAEQRIAQNARVAALRAEANAIAKALREDEAANKVAETPVEEVKTTEEVVEAPQEVIEAPAQEAEITEEMIEAPEEEEEVNEEVTEIPEEEAEVTEEVTEAPEEEEVAEEVTETPEEEEEVAEEVTEIPEEEEEVTEEVTEAPEEEEEVAEEVTEIPEEEEEVTEEVTETPEEEEEVTEEVTETLEEEEEIAEEVTETPEEEEIVEENQEETDGETVGFAKIFKWILATAATAAAIGIFIMLLLIQFGKDNNQLPDDGILLPDNGVVDTTPKGEEVPETPAPIYPVEPEFDMDAFAVSAQNIANKLTTDKDIATNVDIFIEKIGADKLEELVGKYGELPVKNAIAEFLAFTPEIKMNQYIRNNELDYNPNAMNDWYNMLDEASEAYTEATGKNPEGAFMSLEGYDTFKDSREAMKALIIESGDTALLTWYEAKTTGYDAMVQQKRDTEAANAYKEEVKLELVNNNNGSVKLLELQLEQKINGTNVDTLDYTEVYEEFIINNYMYVVAN